MGSYISAYFTYETAQYVWYNENVIYLLVRHVYSRDPQSGDFISISQGSRSLSSKHRNRSRLLHATICQINE